MENVTTNTGIQVRPPSGPLARMAARWVFSLSAGIQVGTLRVTLPDGTSHTFRGARPGPEADCRLHNWRAVLRMLSGGDVGFAEGYMCGDWSSRDLVRLLELAALNQRSLEDRVRGLGVVRLFDRFRHLLRANTRRGSRRNIQAHYDLGNAFYREWLDPTMTYSAGIYASAGETLEAAQIRKYDRLAKAVGARPGMHILEIGCGWGGFAAHAAKTYGCRVTGITLSDEQHAFARERVQREGLSDLIDIRIQDYRDVEGGYDAIVSIEMFEAVGEENWPQYFDVVRDRLADGGKAALQVITIDEGRFTQYRQGADFIQRYVFPGGMLPSPTAFREHAEERALTVEDTFFFGEDYAQTLAEWQARFNDAWPKIELLGFDARFRKLWDYYLAYCRAGFTTGGIDVGQFVLTKA